MWWSKQATCCIAHSQMMVFNPQLIFWFIYPMLNLCYYSIFNNGKPSLGCLTVDLHLRKKKKKKFKMAMSLLWSVSDRLLSTHATRARLRRERACAYPAIVSAASFRFHLSPACPPVPWLPHTSVDPRVSLHRRTRCTAQEVWHIIQDLKMVELGPQLFQCGGATGKEINTWLVKNPHQVYCLSARNTSGAHIA